MSSDTPAIAARGLAKSYLVYPRPADRLLQAVQPRVARAAARLGLPLLRERSYHGVFEALAPLDLEVRRGETVGIIGRNGSGKSTLLQLICGTLTPSAGAVRTHGRVAALLELGSGFNPEYTGIENVFLNASILGLPREAVQARLPAILAFADIGDAVHQPVKTFSSGMAMRLAFAVAAHVDADVLVVDEALAVGDAAFQQKCLRWFARFREAGAVLFCSHDMGAVMAFCDRVVWLDKGRLRMEGEARAVCEAYTAFAQAEAMGLGEGAVRLAKPAAPPPAADAAAAPVVREQLDESQSFGSGDAEILSARLLAADGSELGLIRGDEEVELRVRVRARRPVESLILGFHVKDRRGVAVLGDNTFHATRAAPPALAPGEEVVGRFRFRLPWLMSGRYFLTASAAAGTLQNHVQLHWVDDALFFDVVSPHTNGVLVAVPMAGMAVEPIAAGAAA
jgi:lipopolysaccharide transport system ATP-binding protein